MPKDSSAISGDTLTHFEKDVEGKRVDPARYDNLHRDGLGDLLGSSASGYRRGLWIRLCVYSE